jgi:sugar-specific transcriptional regulator TrmB
MEELSVCFRRLGMAKYPAAVMAAMIANPNSTALQLSERTGVPYTKIYQVITGLVGQRFCQASLERPKRFVASDCQRVVDFLLEKQKEAMASLRRHGTQAIEEANNLTGIFKFSGEAGHCLMEP